MAGWRDVRRWPITTAVLLVALVVPMVLSTAASAIPERSDPLPPADTSEVGATGQLPGTALPTLTDPALDGTAIPASVLAAYQAAESALAVDVPGCRLPWSLVAGIGKIESDHAAGGAVDEAGNTLLAIVGPPLDGTAGNAAIADTDGGALDGDVVWDRAVGPSQFLPGTWATYGADGNADGVSSPANVVDAAVGTGRYLCAGEVDLTVPEQRYEAVFRYNRSDAYVADVLRWADAYAAGNGGLPGVPFGGDAVPPAPMIDAPPPPGLDAAPLGDPVAGGVPAAPLAAGSEGSPAGGVPLAEGGTPMVGIPSDPGGAGSGGAAGVPLRPSATGSSPATTTPSPPPAPLSVPVCSVVLDREAALALLEALGGVPGTAETAETADPTTCVLTGPGARELRVVTAEYPSEDAARAATERILRDRVLVDGAGTQRITVLRAERVIEMTATSAVDRTALRRLAALWPGRTG